MNTTAAVPGKFILLQRLEQKNLFYTQFRFGIDYTRNPKGETAFKILGYAASESEAQNKLMRGRF